MGAKQLNSWIIGDQNFALSLKCGYLEKYFTEHHLPQLALD